MLTGKAVWLIGRELVKDGPAKGQRVAAVKRRIELGSGVAKVQQHLLLTKTGPRAYLHIYDFRSRCPPGKTILS